MKKFGLLLLTLLLLYVASLQAQVVIGRTDLPHPAAVLEIDNGKMGLLLPNVALNADSTQFVLSGGDSLTAIGMIVFNTANVQEGRGVYFWDGIQWHALGLSRLPSPSPPPAPEVIQSNDENVDLQQTAAEEKNDKN